MLHSPEAVEGRGCETGPGRWRRAIWILPALLVAEIVLVIALFQTRTDFSCGASAFAGACGAVGRAIPAFGLSAVCALARPAAMRTLPVAGAGR